MPTSSFYGLGERSVLEIKPPLLSKGASLHNIKQLPQVAYTIPKSEYTPREDDIKLNSHEECLRDKKAYAQNFRHIEELSNALNSHRLYQEVGDEVIVVNPPYPLPTTERVDNYYTSPTHVYHLTPDIGARQSEPTR